MPETEQTVQEYRARVMAAMASVDIPLPPTERPHGTPMSRAENPGASEFGIGAEAAWGIYRRTGSPQPGARVLRYRKAQWMDFLSGFVAAQGHITQIHDRDVIALTAQVEDLSRQLGAARKQARKGGVRGGSE